MTPEQLIVTESVSSPDGTIVIDIVNENIVITSIDGPLTPPTALKAIALSSPLTTKIHETHTIWGVVLIVNKDPTYFPEAIELFIDVTNIVAFNNRKCIGLVVQSDVLRSHEMMSKIKETYSKRITSEVELFDSTAAAVSWANQLLKSASKYL